MDHIQKSLTKFEKEHKKGPAASSSGVLGNLYLNILQVLAPSQWALGEMKTLDTPEEFNDLQKIYASSISHISWKNFKGGSIQVTGPIGHGRSAVMKLLLQNIIQESRVVVINNFADQSSMLCKTQYSILVSFIHQILSQRPSLFDSVRSLIAEILRYNSWSEQTVQSLLCSILQQSRSIDFLVLIHDFESWSPEVRSLWSEISRLFSKFSQSTCTFILSSHGFYPGFTPGKSLELDLSKGKKYKRTLISNAVQHFFQPSYSISPVHKGFSDEIEPSKYMKNVIFSTLVSFDGSLASTRLYLIRLFQSFALSSLAAIETSLSMLPATEEQLYENEIDSLILKPDPLPRWVKVALSWANHAVRPLRVEELAVAIAIRVDCCKISDIENAISIDMERDLHNNLAGLISVENRHVRIVSPLVKDILAKKAILEGEPPGLYGPQEITFRCLQYLGIFLSDDNLYMWDECLSYMSHNHHSQGFGGSSMVLLHYACRFWPVHFLQTERPDESLKQTVVNFLSSNIAKRWFQLYLLDDSPQKVYETSSTEAVVELAKQLTGESTGIEGILDPKQSAIAMASYIGLSSVVCNLLGVEESENKTKRCETRHGCSERNVIFSDVTSSYYLDCVISNDDDAAVKEIFSVNPKTTANQFPLHKAAWAGCLKVVQALLELLDNPARANDEGRTPLHMAALCGHIDVIRLLVGEDRPKDRPGGADKIGMINSQDKDLKTPLIMATELGHTEIARYLVQSGANIALRDGTGKSAVHCAVLHSLQILEVFIAYDNGVINMKDGYNRTPLHFAARDGDINATRTIIEAARGLGINKSLTAYDGENMTPLHHAARNGHSKITEILMAAEDGTADEDSISEFQDESSHLPSYLAARHGHLAVIKTMVHGIQDSRNDLLIAASSSGQLLVVEYLLRQRFDPDGEDLTSQRPLTAAAANGWSSVVHTLLNHHADINLVDIERLTPLHHAAKNGRKDVTSILLTHRNHSGENTNVNAPDLSRYTPLHWAALEGHANVIELLLAHGANIHARSHRQETPLHLAVQSTSSVRLLLDGGADPEVKDVTDQTPILIAVQRGCIESFRLLLYRGASLDVYDNENNDALYYAISQNEAAIVEEILKRDTVQEANSYWDNLELAVRSAALDVLKFFISKIPEAVTIKDGRNRTLLCLAADLESPEVLTILLEAGSDVNNQGRKRRTPLLEAILAEKVENVLKLIEWKADIGLRDEDGDTALCAAACRHSPDIVKILIKAKAFINDWNSFRKTPLYRAAYYGEVKIVRLLLEADADPNICDKDTWSPLHAAADNLEVSRALVDYGAAVNYQKRDNWSPLHLSASWGYSAVVQLLLEKGADPNLVNDDGMTALHFAVDKPHVLDALLGHQGTLSVDINKPDNAGTTAIHMAITQCSTAVVKKIMNHNAKFNGELKDGTTYLDVAIERNRPETLAALLGVDELSESRTLWDFQYLVAAYWRAIKKAQRRSIEALLKADGRLIHEISEQGSDGLQEYLRIPEERDEEDGLPAQFVDLGLNPFKRRQNHSLTCFELGLMTRRNVDPFLKACLKHISTKLKIDTPALGFKELRIATEMDDLDLWTKFAPLVGELPSESDQDDWNIHHFLYQAMPRKKYIGYDKSSLRKTKTPTALVWPHLWQVLNDGSVETIVNISDKGLQASFSGEHPKYHSYELANIVLLARPKDRDYVTIRANFPFPPRKQGLSYFELSIMEVAHETERETLRDRYFVIGLSGEFSNLLHAVPGWYRWSLGYHGDDGKVYYENNPLPGDIDGYAKPYDVCDTVGCGIDYERGDYFFTRNGEVVCKCISTTHQGR